MEINREEWAKMVGNHSPLETLRSLVEESLSSRDQTRARIALVLLARERHRLRVERQMLTQRMARIGNALERALQGPAIRLMRLPSVRSAIQQGTSTAQRFNSWSISVSGSRMRLWAI